MMRIKALSTDAFSPWDSPDPLRALTLAPVAQVDRPSTNRRVEIQTGVGDPENEAARRNVLPQFYRTAPSRLIAMKPGLLETSMCVALTAQGNYVAETLRSRSQAEGNGYRLDPSGFSTLPDRPTSRLKGVSVLLGSPTGGNYFHWMLEAVSRYLVARGKVPTGARILVPTLKHREREALLLAGVSDQAILEIPDHHLLEIDELYVPPRGQQGASTLVPLSVATLRNLVEPATHATQRLFISRAGAGRRRILNDAKVSDIARKHGFRVLSAEKLTVREQAHAFAEARVVMALHGAGLTNILFCPRDALVIELQPPRLDDARLQLFWNLAALSALRYIQVVCAESPGQDRLPDSSRDVVVNIEQLNELLTEVLNKEDIA